MDRAEFEASLQRDGYEILSRDMAPNTTNPDHTHPFDARIMISAGSMTLAMGGERHAFGPGDWCVVEAGTVHAEESGPAGASIIVGRRHRSA